LANLLDIPGTTSLEELGIVIPDTLTQVSLVDCADFGCSHQFWCLFSWAEDLTVKMHHFDEGSYEFTGIYALEDNLRTLDLFEAALDEDMCHRIVHGLPHLRKLRCRSVFTQVNCAARCLQDMHIIFWTNEEVEEGMTSLHTALREERFPVLENLTLADEGCCPDFVRIVEASRIGHHCLQARIALTVVPLVGR
jgi:hypothetical protein